MRTSKRLRTLSISRKNINHKEHYKAIIKLFNSLSLSLSLQKQKLLIMPRGKASH
jgi:hypothetical protein